MSKSYLTVKQAYIKLGLSGGGNSFIRKSELIATGKCDASLLEKYRDNDYVVDDDIVKKNNMSIIFELYNTSFPSYKSINMDGAFNPSKPFKIECEIIFNTLHNGNNTGFIIVSGNTNLTCCKARVNDGTNYNKNSYWFSADALGEHVHGITKEGQLFTFTFEYAGDNKEPKTTSNLDKLGIINMPLTPHDMSSSVIWIGRDPRTSSENSTNLYIQKLVIYQD